MTTALFSPSWYRVAALTPRLRSHARIHRHQYRGQTWHILQDLSTERFHRFSPAGYFIAGLMDGRRTVQEIWEIASARLGDEAPTQDEMIALLAQLHGADVLQCDVSPDTAELLRRYEQQQRRRWRQILSPFAWRIPLLDPERFLGRFLPVVRPLTGWLGALLWVAVVPPALVLAGMHWVDLSQNFIDRVLTPQNLAILWLLFPVIKALHELGHAFLTRAYGGEVHDMGVMILVLTPVPYVDASSAWAFRERWRRVAVGAAGMLVELFLAALALFVWLNAEPGTVRALAYNTMLIAGVSTILFNANPLLRYDGYYILSDLLEIPNLRPRSSAYMGYLAERYLFGRREAEAPPATPGERAWFVAYSIASFLYRMSVFVAIILFLASRFFTVGIALAALAAGAWIVLPAAKGLAFLFSAPRLRDVRARAVTVTAAILAVVAVVVGLVPVPLRTQLEGVVWIPDDSLVRVGTEGFVERLVAQPGARVRAGDALIELRDPVLTTRVVALAARLVELRARYSAEFPTDRVKAEIIKDDIRYAEENVARARERTAELTVRSRVDGVLVVTRADDLLGRFVRKGELLGYVMDLGTVRVRTVVPQEEIDLVRQRTQKIELRLAERLEEVLAATVMRIAPSATDQLPSAALGSRGGGQIAVDPTDRQGDKAIERLVQVDLELPSEARVKQVGGRVYIRFDHGREPLVYRWYRGLRQLFTARFNV